MQAHSAVCGERDGSFPFVLFPADRFSAVRISACMDACLYACIRSDGGKHLQRITGKKMEDGIRQTRKEGRKDLEKAHEYTHTYTHTHTHREREREREIQRKEERERKEERG
mmetsp:Transcript_216/g.527  ORF Transcript_216/g.527 Transcript_216/m.527 type:complete len:112 (+) Transcript_216:328-663(+)